MVGEFTDEQVGKRVVSQDGGHVGTVDSVRDGSIYVEVAGDVDADLRKSLGWDGVVNREERELEGEFVSMITDDAIRLRV